MPRFHEIKVMDELTKRGIVHTGYRGRMMVAATPVDPEVIPTVWVIALVDREGSTEGVPGRAVILTQIHGEDTAKIFVSLDTFEELDKVLSWERVP